MSKVNIKLRFIKCITDENTPKRLIAKLLAYVTINGERLYALGEDQVADMATYIDFFIDAEGKGASVIYNQENEYEYQESRENYFTLGALMRVCGTSLGQYLDSISEKIINTIEVNSNGDLLDAEFNG